MHQQVEKEPSKNLFKRYAFSTCIADGFPEGEIVSEYSAAARGYLELGDLPIEAHQEATLLGREYLKKKYLSKSVAKLTLMKCIDFYESEELHGIYLKYKGD